LATRRGSGEGKTQDNSRNKLKSRQIHPALLKGEASRKRAFLGRGGGGTGGELSQSLDQKLQGMAIVKLIESLVLAQAVKEKCRVLLPRKAGEKILRKGGV